MFIYYAKQLLYGDIEMETQKIKEKIDAIINELVDMKVELNNIDERNIETKQDVKVSDEKIEKAEDTVDVEKKESVGRFPKMSMTMGNNENNFFNKPKKQDQSNHQQKGFKTTSIKTIPVTQTKKKDFKKYF